MVIAKKRTGLPSLAYTGVEAPTPPNLTIDTRPPSDSDNTGYRIGDLWLQYVPGFPNSGTFEDLWVLIGLERGVAHWVHAAGQAGGILFEEGDVGGQISPDGTDTLFHLGWANINTFGIPANNAIYYSLNEVIRWSATNNTGTTGVIYLNGNGADGTGGTRFMHGIQNGTFLGLNSGNFTLTGAGNTGIGNAALTSLTDGIRNTAVGLSALSDVTTGDNNVAVGHSALTNLTTGNDNVAIGRDALLSATSGSTNTAVGISAGSAITIATTNTLIGSNSGLSLTSGGNNVGIGSSSLIGLLTGAQNIAIGTSAGSNDAGAENNNIIIGNTGTLAEDDTIRIGTQGTQTRAFCAGITGVTVANETNVVINSVTGQLGVGGSSGQAGDNAFLALQPNTAGGTIANGPANTQQYLGTAISGGPLTESYDPDNVFYPGDGIAAPATFTAPATGIYKLQMQVALSPFAAGSTLVTHFLIGMAVNGNLAAAYITGMPNWTTGAGSSTPRVLQQMTIQPQLASGDVVTFFLEFLGGASTMNFSNASWVVPVGASGQANWIQGYRVA